MYIDKRLYPLHSYIYLPRKDDENTPVHYKNENRSLHYKALFSGSQVLEYNCLSHSNPYLLFAVCLAAGLDGIKRNLNVPKEIEGNIYEMSKEELEAAGVDAIPSNLSKACHYFEDDEFMKNVLGEHVHKKYLEAKRGEWNRFREQVTAWEIEEYLYKI